MLGRILLALVMVSILNAESIFADNLRRGGGVGADVGTNLQADGGVDQVEPPCDPPCSATILGPMAGLPVKINVTADMLVASGLASQANTMIGELIQCDPPCPGLSAVATKVDACKKEFGDLLENPNYASCVSKACAAPITLNMRNKGPRKHSDKVDAKFCDDWKNLSSTPAFQRHILKYRPNEMQQRQIENEAQKMFGNSNSTSDLHLFQAGDAGTVSPVILDTRQYHMDNPENGERL